MIIKMKSMQLNLHAFLQLIYKIDKSLHNLKLIDKIINNTTNIIKNTVADIIAIIFHLGVLNGYFEKSTANVNRIFNKTKINCTNFNFCAIYLSCLFQTYNVSCKICVAVVCSI